MIRESFPSTIREIRLAIAGMLGLVSLQCMAQPESSKFYIENSESRWFVDSQARQGHGKIASFLGRESLWLRGGSQVVLAGDEFTTGVIEFDVAPMDEGQFTGILFRREDFRNYENIYLRAHMSGQFSALQYAPAINGSSTWQLYPEFSRAVDLPRNTWTHFRLEVSESTLTVTMNNQAEPVLEVERLRGLPKSGSVAFWARKNAAPEVWATAISNVTVTPSAISHPADSRVELSPPSSAISSWSVSTPVPSSEIWNASTVGQLLEGANNWNRISHVEQTGLVNLNREFVRERGTWISLAKTQLESATDTRKVLDLGYSDEVIVIFNGKPVFSGVNGWESRYPGSMGFVKPGNAKVYLDMKKGSNELILALRNTNFGWGFVAFLDDD